MTLSSRRTKAFESKRQRLKACCPRPAALKPGTRYRRLRWRGRHAGGPQRQSRARALAGERRGEDPGGPRRALRGEELRDPLRPPARRAGAAAADRRRHARVRDHRGPARAAAHRRARAHLAAGAVAQVGAGRPAPAALPLRPHEDDPLARALLAAAPDLPLRSPVEQHRLRRPGHRRVRGRVPRPAVHGARHAAGAGRRPAVARGAARGLPRLVLLGVAVGVAGVFLEIVLGKAAVKGIGSLF